MLNVDLVDRAGNCPRKLRASQRREFLADIEDLKAANRISLLRIPRIIGVNKQPREPAVELRPVRAIGEP